MNNHNFWAWAAVLCMSLAIYTGYEHKQIACTWGQYKNIQGVYGQKLQVGKAGEEDLAEWIF